MEAVTPTVEFHAMDTMEKMKMINFSVANPTSLQPARMNSLVASCTDYECNWRQHPFIELGVLLIFCFFAQAQCFNGFSKLFSHSMSLFASSPLDCVLERRALMFDILSGMIYLT